MKNCQKMNRRAKINKMEACDFSKGHRCYGHCSHASNEILQAAKLEETHDDLKRLSELSIGQSAQIVYSGCERGAYRRRLLDMGMTRGTVVKIKKVAPFGDPINIELRGYELCLRRCDIANIIVKIL